MTYIHLFGKFQCSMDPHLKLRIRIRVRIQVNLRTSPIHSPQFKNFRFLQFFYSRKKNCDTKLDRYLLLAIFLSLWIRIQRPRIMRIWIRNTVNFRSWIRTMSGIQESKVCPQTLRQSGIKAIHM